MGKASHWTHDFRLDSGTQHNRAVYGLGGRAYGRGEQSEYARPHSTSPHINGPYQWFGQF
ncbi:hypothetical protein BOO71_0003691 [Deinococcus marmoris]|uniref:Uncharacterized protein n=1 Tax=Deinococcus marmoris TaxID=249408 RepID=A0A1U7P1T1_9DEIO|nr:hypothetical protein BOO71_0003691 [Deinococcus marmoris]